MSDQWTTESDRVPTALSSPSRTSPPLRAPRAPRAPRAQPTSWLTRPRPRQQTLRRLTRSRPSLTRPPRPTRSRRATARRRRRPVDPVKEFKDELASQFGDWYVIHSYAGYENRVKANLENRTPAPQHGGLHLPGRGPHGRGHRDQERPAQARQARPDPRLRPGPHGPHRRVLGRRPAHAGRHRLRRPRPPARAADARRGLLDARAVARSPSSRRGRAGAAQGRRSQISRLRGRRVGHRHGGARSRPCRPRSPRSTPTPRSSRCSSPSSAGRPRSSCRSTRSPRSERAAEPSASAVLQHCNRVIAHGVGPRQERTKQCLPKKKISGLIKLQIQAGAATPAPPVGPALGQHGVNIMEFCKAYNAATESQRGNVIPVEITVYEDRSFTFITKTPPAAELIKKAAGVPKGSGDAAQRQGRHAHQGPAARDRRAEDAGPERQRRRRRDEDHRRHRPLRWASTPSSESSQSQPAAAGPPARRPWQDQRWSV